MLKSFTENYEDNSTEAGFEFTFRCDVCQDGYKSSFVQSETYKKGKGIRGFARGARIIGDLLGGAVGNIGSSVEYGSEALSERFEGMSPAWHKEHEKAFENAQNEAGKHFHRCHSCNRWVCDSCFNEDEGLCTECAPRQEVYVAKARSEAMKRNIDETSEKATVWKGKLESKTTICPVCGKPAGKGKFCNNCGASLSLDKCPKCGSENAKGVKFCNNCGSPMTAPKQSVCPSCGAKTEPGIKFCNECGQKLK